MTIDLRQVHLGRRHLAAHRPRRAPAVQRRHQRGTTATGVDDQAWRHRLRPRDGERYTSGRTATPPMVDASADENHAQQGQRERLRPASRELGRSVHMAHGVRRRCEHRVSVPETGGFLVWSSFCHYLLCSAVLPVDLLQGTFDHEPPTHRADDRFVDSQVSCDLVG